MRNECVSLVMPLHGIALWLQKTTVNLVLFWYEWGHSPLYCNLYFIIMINALVEMLIYKCNSGFTTCAPRLKYRIHFCSNKLEFQDSIFYFTSLCKIDCITEHFMHYTLQFNFIKWILIHKHLYGGNNITNENHFQIHFMHVQCRLVEIKIGKINKCNIGRFVWKILKKNGEKQIFDVFYTQKKFGIQFPLLCERKQNKRLIFPFFSWTLAFRRFRVNEIKIKCVFCLTSPNSKKGIKFTL